MRTNSQSPNAPADGGYPLAGPSDLPDPATHAYRPDLADVALAGRVIASHYAEPLLRHLAVDADLLECPDAQSETVGKLKAGDALLVLDNSRGWAWGYAPDGRVGYVSAVVVVA